MRMTILILSLFSFDAAAQTDWEWSPTDWQNEQWQNPGAGRRDSSGTASQAFTAARDVLEDAAARTRDRKVKKMLEKARRATLQADDGEACREGAWASVERAFLITNHTIYVCPSFGSDGNPAHARQVMLHEIAHLAGIHDECAADRKAREVLNLVGAQTTRSGYDPMCTRGR